jgi:hypothetical protein
MTSIAVAVMMGLFALAVPIAVSIGLLALVLLWLFSTLPLDRALGEVAWATGNEFLLFAVPLYILMGEILLRSGIAMRMYGAMTKWLSWLPGGLMHSNIGASAMFAATSGSSVATAATIGTVALPQQRKHGYNERLFLGSVAAGGTLGILIPPSISRLAIMKKSCGLKGCRREGMTKIRKSSFWAANPLDSGQFSQRSGVGLGLGPAIADPGAVRNGRDRFVFVASLPVRCRLQISANTSSFECPGCKICSKKNQPKTAFCVRLIRIY